jgi:hypothetical protein
MRSLENSSATKIVIGHTLSIVGALGLAVSSFQSFDTLVFFWPSDRLRLLRAALMFIISAVLIASGALLFHDNHWWRAFIRRLPLYVLGMGSVGLMNHVAQLYLHRRPAWVTTYEATWFCIALVTFVLAIHQWRPRKRHASRAA